VNFIDAPSPNFNDRKRAIRFVVLHYTGMETGVVAQERMCDPAAQVSAHYMVEEDGRVFRLVEEDRRAWHAGVSSWQGETDINSASIGIEIVNGGHDFGLPEFPAVQIEAVIGLVRAVMDRHGVSARDVIGHSDIAPGRKQDPGEKFPWQALAEAGCALAVPDGVGVSGDPAELLQRIGYGVEPGLEEVVAAFQRRFRPVKITGQLDEETQNLICRVARQP
jgi:N-acetylmuramoyl-L-alanine amidase